MNQLGYQGEAAVDQPKLGELSEHIVDTEANASRLISLNGALMMVAERLRGPVPQTVSENQSANIASGHIARLSSANGDIASELDRMNSFIEELEKLI